MKACGSQRGEERHRCTGTHRRQRYGRQTEHVEERQTGRGPIRRGGLDHFADDVGRRNEIAQGQHRPLRLARRARGIEERGEVIPGEIGTIDGDIGLSTHLGARGPSSADDGQGAELDIMLCSRGLPRLGRSRMSHEHAGLRVG
jgi:hypothetical protein